MDNVSGVVDVSSLKKQEDIENTRKKDKKHS